MQEDALHERKERERLLAELQAAIKEVIRTRDESEAHAAVKAWRAARTAFPAFRHTVPEKQRAKQGAKPLKHWGI
jgi:hypothetical protein